ncbi:hypothetical protein RO21_11275 [[Actinobacillus] muris]|uniref:Uncharacterized protein n=1 Tax=Muribacter muris TaxID=67855 RepID=A0A0J5P495_9PAST|nr:hypothetical protein [Muribacter muris]KMK50515.1 hypothetical protein RO21_11275 [[Actinobacillus] muris] [Muribacter muris]
MRNTANYFSGCHIGVVHTGELSVTQHYHVIVHLNINPALKEQDLVNQFFQGSVATVFGQQTQKGGDDAI